jgi:uncharacterized membrane protein YkvA (DUF1232 family)
MATKGPAKSGRSSRARAGAKRVATAVAAAERDAVAPRKPETEPLITRAELKRVLYELATTIAPGDIGDLLAEEHVLRERGASLKGLPGEVFHAQLDLALACLRDHAAGEVPQIPFYTISLLAAAVAYLADDLDIIPDFLAGRGVIDDALVLAMACSLGDNGLRRYCAAKGLDATKALGLLVTRAPRRGDGR